MLTRAAKRGILPTAIVFIKSKCGDYHPVCALLDSGSELNLISEETAKRLQLDRSHGAQAISCVADVNRHIHFNVFGTNKARISNFEWSSNLAVINTICTTHSQEFIDIALWKLPKGVVLAEPHFHELKKKETFSLIPKASLILSESASAQLGIACPA